MGTGANMIVRNQTNAPFTTTLSNLNCMYQGGDDGSQLQDFNDQTIAPYTSYGPIYIEADGSFPSCSFSQSNFQINYLNGSMGINLGTGPDFNTSVTSNTNPTQIQAVLAPNEPAASGVSYSFYFYGGPGLLAPLVNSVINANLAAFVQAVSVTPFVIPFGSVDISIDSANVTALSCPYAAAVPAGTNQLQFSIILNVSGSVGGSVGTASVSNPMSVSVTDMNVLIEGTADLSAVPPAIAVTLFACSLGGYTINPGLLEWLVTLPGWIILQTFATPPDMAGILNATAVNQTIVQGINNALQKF